MASESIGTYAVRVVGDTSHYVKAMEQTVATSKQMVVAVQQTNAAIVSTSGGAKNATFAFQQLALAVQDGASVFGTAGFSGAIRAAGNNLIQMASLIGPLAGTFSAFAITGIQLVADQFKKMGDEAKNATTEVKKFSETADRIRENAKQGKAIADIGQIGGFDAAGRKVQDLSQTRDDSRQILAEAERERKVLGDRRAAIQSAIMEEFLVKQSFRSGGGGDPNDFREQFAGRNDLALADATDAQRERLRIVDDELAALKKLTMEENARTKGIDQQIQAAKQRREELALEQANKEMRKFAGDDGFGADAKVAEAERKRRVQFEDARQKLIAENNRDMTQQEDEQRRKAARAPQFAGAAGFGSASAAESIARAQAMPNELVAIQEEARAIQQKALSELSEIRLNTRPNKAEEVTVEAFD